MVVRGAIISGGGRTGSFAKVHTPCECVCFGRGGVRPCGSCDRNHFLVGRRLQSLVAYSFEEGGDRRQLLFPNSPNGRSNGRPLEW